MLNELRHDILTSMSVHKMELFRNANLGLRFILELCLLAALAYSGFHIVNHGLLSWIIAITAPLAATSLWSIFIAPRAKRQLAHPFRLALELFLFGVSIAGLWHTSHASLAIGFTITFAANEILLLAWRQQNGNK